MQIVNLPVLRLILEKAIGMRIANLPEEADGTRLTLEGTFTKLGETHRGFQTSCLRCGQILGEYHLGCCGPLRHGFYYIVMHTCPAFSPDLEADNPHA